MIAGAVMGWTWRDALDLLIKLSPAITIVFGLAAAQVQWRRQQRLNAELIAKNHYREMIEHLLRNADLLVRGSTPEALERLRADPVEYRRYVMLFAMVAFALQEIYFATDPRRNKHWAAVIRLFFDPFRPFLRSEATFTAAMFGSVHPEFAVFTRELMGSEIYPHPAKP